MKNTNVERQMHIKPYVKTRVEKKNINVTNTGYSFLDTITHISH